MSGFVTKFANKRQSPQAWINSKVTTINKANNI